jgi:hypothetical protein
VLAQRAAAERENEAEREKERRRKRGRGSGRKEEEDRKMEMEKEKSGHGMKKKGPQLVSTNSSAGPADVMTLSICAPSDVTVVCPYSPFPASSPPDSSGATPIPFPQDAPAAVPKTPPPRHRRLHTLTPLSKSIIEASGSGSALFTPTPRKITGLFDSPLFSPSVSASNQREMEKAKMSPIRPVTSDKSWEGDADDEDDEAERLSRALDVALEELDVPSSSLPIASSDFDTEPPATSSAGGHLSASDEQENDEDETMRFWSAGLPPSSPPPPTSPLHSPTDDEEMRHRHV